MADAEIVSTPHEEMTPEERMLEAVMGFEGGEGWVNLEDRDQDFTISFGDPLATLAKKMKATVTVDSTLWEEEGLKPHEDPEELKESGAITVSLKDVRNSIGRDREEWKVALDSELQSLRNTGAIHSVAHVPSVRVFNYMTQS